MGINVIQVFAITAGSIDDILELFMLNWKELSITYRNEKYILKVFYAKLEGVVMNIFITISV